MGLRVGTTGPGSQEAARAVSEGRLASRSEELLAALRETVTYRLAVANPKHFNDRM